MCVRACVRPSVIHVVVLMFPRYLQYLLTDFRQTFVTGAPRDRDLLIAFWGQKVKGQGHSMTKCAPEFAAKHLVCGGLSDRFIANLLLSVPVKKIENKSIFSKVMTKT